MYSRVNGSHLLMHCGVTVVFHCDMGPVSCFTQKMQYPANSCRVAIIPLFVKHLSFNLECALVPVECLHAHHNSCLVTLVSSSGVDTLTAQSADFICSFACHAGGLAGARSVVVIHRAVAPGLTGCPDTCLLSAASCSAR